MLCCGNRATTPNTTFNVSIMNDTGCSIQTIFSTDLAALGYNQLTYQGHRGAVALTTGNGVIRRRKIVIEIQIIKADGTITPWFRANAVVTPPRPGLQHRLSGRAIRDHLYFATAPGNTNLFVAKKMVFTTQLPVV
jgi:hypothetical protein